MQKLIKINTDHYVIVDNSEIKEGDYLYSFSNNKIVIANKLTNLYVHSKKITHSTQPLELLTLSENGLSGMGFSKVRPLNIFNVKELIGEVDVEKKAHDWFMTEKFMSSHIADIKSFVAGYNQVLEDNKEKKYTEEDLKYMFECGRNYQNNAEITFRVSMEYLQQSKTEWDVEFIDGKLKLK